MATEAETIADLAVAAAGDVKQMEAGDTWSLVAMPEGYRVEHLDWSDKMTGPRRSKGDNAVHDVASFLAAVAQRSVPGTDPVLYADEERNQLVGVLDDDHADAPGWRQYRVHLDLRRTPEWSGWRTASDTEFSQNAFAEFVEEHAPDFIEPDAATMLELAQSIEGKTSVNWKVGSRLKDGSRQVLWDETIETKAGSSGQLAVPDRFVIGVKPFYGAPDLKVEVLLRIRIREKRLLLIPKIVRLAEYERAVFNAMVTEIAAAPEAPSIIRGPAPS